MWQIANLDAKGNGLHDKDTIRENSSNFLHTGEILNWIPDVPVFIQQLELAYREEGEKMSVMEKRWKRRKLVKEGKEEE